MEKDLTCPECGEEAIKWCKCPFRESECKNGHVWHYDTNTGVRIIGHKPKHGL